MKFSIHLVMIAACAATADGKGPAKSDQAISDGWYYWFPILTASDLPYCKPDGRAWDPLGGAPDPFLYFESYRSGSDSSPIWSRSSSNVQDSYVGSWEMIEACPLYEDGWLIIGIWDADAEESDRVDVFSIRVSELAIGENSFEGEHDSQLSFELQICTD